MAKSVNKVTSTWSSLITKAGEGERRASGLLYRTEPVSLDTFVNSPEYLNQGMWGMSEPQKDFIEAATDFENNKTFLVLMVGKGGGKNWSCGITYLYAVYKLLCMFDPHEYLDHNPAKAITLLNVAINETQARKNFFNPVVEIIKQAGPKAFKQFGFDPETDIQTKQVNFPKNIEIMSYKKNTNNNNK